MVHWAHVIPLPLFNLGWSRNFFWDGGASDMESQVVGPITNPLEMHEDLAHTLHELNTHPEYPELFRKAFGRDDTITTRSLMYAITQFERTLISSDSRYDQYRRGQIALTPAGTARQSIV